jgi:hypothetical protein
MLTVDLLKRAKRLSLLMILTITGAAACNKDEDRRRYCDQTGCYECQGENCYPVAGAPTRADPGQVVLCENDSVCGAGRVCNLGRCETACADDASCRTGNVCVAGRCRPAGSAQCGITGALCTEDGQCGAGRRCISRACANPCPDGKCALGQVCQAGACVDDPAPQTVQCLFDTDCGGGKGGFRCINAYCLPSCLDSKQCQGGAACIKGSCRADKRPI